MPAPFTMSADVQVRFRDTDAMGHVNNAVYLSYLEIARVEEKGTGRLIAEARTVQACFDYKAGKVQRIPEAVRAGTLALEQPGTVLDHKG